MASPFPTAHEYAFEQAHHPAMTIVDLQAEQAAGTAAYQNQCF